MTEQKYFQNILVAVDFSPTSEAAWKQAMWLAKWGDVSLTLLHVITNSTPFVRSNSVLEALVDQEASDIQLQQDSDDALRRLVDESKNKDLDVECITEFGVPFVEIIKLVQEERFELVIAGLQGHSALEQIFIGSTAKRLIRKCPSPVWLVKPNHVDSIKVVLAATDFSNVSHKAVTHGLQIAKQAGAEFHLLHVIDSKDVPQDLVSRIPRGSTMRHEINEEAKRRFQGFIDTLPSGGLEIHSHLTFGTPWQEIQRLVMEKSVDLLAIGTVGRSGIQGLLLGNTAERILDTCDCSILTVKPDGFVSPIAPDTFS